MAIIEAISSKADIKTIIKYVTQDKKTDEKLITGKDCLAESSLEEMLYTKNLYNKNSGRQYIHIIQSFDPKDNLSKEQVHNAGLKLAEKFNGFQVLVATHIDKEHLHNHLIINSVSFENGSKIQMSKKDLQKIKDYSDEICIAIGASVIPKKENTNYIKRNEYRVAERGKSWKFKLMNAIDLSLAESNNKEDFIKIMNKLGYQVNWTDTRKNITYTTPEGYKCRDNKLFDEKYLKGEMENEFNGRIKKKNQLIIPTQVPMQTQMKAEFITISPDLWSTIVAWIQSIQDKIKNMEYKMDKAPSTDLIIQNLERDLKDTVQIQIMEQMRKYQEELKQVQQEKWKYIILKGIPIGIVLGSLVTLFLKH